MAWRQTSNDLRCVFTCLLSCSYTAGSAKQQDVINQYAASLQKVWEGSFGKEHVMKAPTIHRVLQRIMEEYDRYRKTNLYGNAKRGIFPKNIRKVNKEWYNNCINNVK